MSSDESNAQGSKHSADTLIPLVYSELRKLARERARELSRQATSFAIEHLISRLKEKYSGLDDVVAHLDTVETDVIENADQFRPPAESVPLIIPSETSVGTG